MEAQLSSAQGEAVHFTDLLMIGCSAEHTTIDETRLGRILDKLLETLIIS